MSAYNTVIQVRFGHVDPAGIAYFPRIYDWFHQAMEAWFDEALGRPYADVIRADLGFPAVRSEAEFLRPCALGDDLQVHLAVERVGERSVTLAYVVTGSDPSDRRATGRTVVVATRLREMRSTPVPAEIRAAMEPYRSESGKSG